MRGEQEANSEWRVANEVISVPIRYSLLAIRAFRYSPSYATAGFGCRAIASTINPATMHSAPATKNAGR
jgi:hypothetical protein